MEGHSFQRLLEKPDQPWKNVVFGTLNGETECLRTSHWKVALSKDEKIGALFDLANDPDETENLYYNPAYQEAVRRLTVLLHQVKPLPENSGD